MINILKDIKRLGLILLIGGLLLFAFPFITRADLATSVANYKINFNGPVKIIQTIEERVCKDNGCIDFYSLKSDGSCVDICSIFAPGIRWGDKNKLVIRFTDGTSAESLIYSFGMPDKSVKTYTYYFIATVIGENIQLSATDSMGVLDGDILQVMSHISRGFVANFKYVAVLGGINLLIECLVALLFLGFKKYSRKILLGVVMVNIISWPLLIIFLGLSINSILWYFVGGEVLVWLFEGCVIALLFKKYISLKTSMWLSFVTNFVTVLVSIIYPLLIKYLV